MDQIAIGRYIARKRKEQNLTQEQLSEQLGVSNKTISKWENGEDYQYMGWPNGQGNIPLLSGANGGYCMLASSQHKDAAWQLLKTLLSVEYDDIVAAIMMPVMRDDFQEAIAALPDLNEKEGLDIRPEDIEKLVNLMEGPSLAPRTSGIDAIIR